MAEYIFAFLILLVAAIVVYLLYERMYRKETIRGSGLYGEALADLLDGRHEQAFSKLRRVVADDTTNVEAYIRLGQILREYHQAERALQVHRDLTLRPGLTQTQKGSILEQLARDYLALNNHEMAQAALKELRTLQPDNRWGTEMHLKVLESQKKWEEAFSAAADAVKQQGSKSKRPLAILKYRMGEEQIRRREYHKGRILFKEAIGLDPTMVEAYLAVGDSYQEERRFEDAVAFWSKLIDVVPAQGHLVIARLKTTLFELGRYGDLFGICEHIVANDPGNVEARLTIAEIHSKKGESAQAIEILNRLVEDQPENLRPAIQLMRLYLERGERQRLDLLFRTLERNWERTAKGNPEPKGESQLVSSHV